MPTYTRRFAPLIFLLALIAATLAIPKRLACSDSSTDSASSIAKSSSVEGGEKGDAENEKYWTHVYQLIFFLLVLWVFTTATSKKKCGTHWKVHGNESRKMAYVTSKGCGVEDYFWRFGWGMGRYLGYTSDGIAQGDVVRLCPKCLQKYKQERADQDAKRAARIQKLRTECDSAVSRVKELLNELYNQDASNYLTLCSYIKEYEEVLPQSLLGECARISDFSHEVIIDYDEGGWGEIRRTKQFKVHQLREAAQQALAVQNGELRRF